jgi:hypothetical protein
MATCRDTTVQVVLAAGTQAVAWGTPRVDHATGASGAIGAATAYALVGDTLVSVDTVPGSVDAGPALPGQTRWLLDTLSAAVRRATGSTADLPTPTQAAVRAAARYRPLDRADLAAVPKGAEPAGMLTPADLHDASHGTAASTAEWRINASDGATPIQAQLPACASAGGDTGVGGAATLVYGRGAANVYLARSPGVASGADPARAWSLYELRITLDPSELAAVRAAFARAAACPRQEIGTILGTLTDEVSGTSRVVAWQVDKAGAVRAVQAWILQGNRLVQIQSELEDPTAAKASAPLPGLGWFREVVDRAAQRMDG